MLPGRRLLLSLSLFQIPHAHKEAVAQLVILVQAVEPSSTFHKLLLLKQVPPAVPLVTIWNGLLRVGIAIHLLLITTTAMIRISDLQAIGAISPVRI